MKKLKDNLIFAAKLVVILIPLLLVAALPTTLNTNQFNTFGPLSHKEGGNLGTNMTVGSPLAVTNSDVTSMLELNAGAGGGGVVRANAGGGLKWQITLDTAQFYISDFDDIIALNILQGGRLTATATNGNDVRGHERFQFCNRANTAVTSANETTLTNGTASGSVVVPADYLTQGAQIIVEMGGTTANGAAGAPITNRVYLDGTNIATGTIASEGASTWNWRSTTTIRTTGASGTFKTTGSLVDSLNSGITHPSGSGNIDTTVPHTLNVTVQSAPDQTAETLLITILRP